MEIKGKIIAVLDARTGATKSGGSWTSQEYVIETLDKYPKKCCFNVFGIDKIEKYNIRLGEVLTVQLDINAREYKGRWYNDIKAWSVTRGQAQAQAQPTPAPAPPAPAPGPDLSSDDDELPFF